MIPCVTECTEIDISPFSSIIDETKITVLAAVRRYIDTDCLYAIDDIVQETYLRAYRALNKGSLQDSKKLKSYLYTIAKNETLRANKKYHREIRKIEKKKTGLTQEFGSLIHPHENNRADWDLWLQTIPAPFAEVVRLTLQGLSVREISGTLCIAPGTVKSRLSRALKMIRKLVEGL